MPPIYQKMKLKELSAAYRPITSTPFPHSSNYREIAPCNALRPYICCFWGNEYQPSADLTASRLVIPDTCMDIIIRSDLSGSGLTASFCTIDERSYSSDEPHNTEIYSTFGIRFFCWSAALFTAESFRHTKNNVYLPDDFFRGITSQLFDIVLRFHTLSERARETEKLLIRRLVPDRLDSNFMNVLSDMITSCGRLKISGIARKNAISERKMERVFAENTGVSPKTLSDLIRYQLVWQEIAAGGADILDLAEKYGYTDQAHLLNDFRKRHGMTPTQAVGIAMSDFYNTNK